MMNAEIKSLVAFQHGVSAWWGVTVMWSGKGLSSVVEKVMFSSRDSAEIWLHDLGLKKPWKWLKTDNDLYLRYRKG